MTSRAWGILGYALCWFYCVAWVLVWSMSEALPPVLRVLEPIVSGRAHARVSALLAGALIFAAAPFMREETRIKRVFYAIATVALVAPGLWLMVESWARGRPAVSLAEAVLWLQLPLLIAAWVLAGTQTPVWPKLYRR